MSGPRSFDPVVVGNRETDAWVAYYRHDWIKFLRSSVGMVAAGFGMSRARTLAGAWYVLKANQLWAPFPDNQPDGARAYMRRFYELVADSEHFDPAEAARLEVEWWRIHRAHQHDSSVTRVQLEDALVELYSYVYKADKEAVRPAAAHRVDAMDYSDRWVAAGCKLDDRLLVEERRALVASYAALRIAVED
ncbi:hypothetical protein GCM10009554_58420 [Kribbella koreensis]|uniref:Uncharacterized protein n=1 Tax=Kribbella koreensis TaxID=57909 RepID=A0ABP4BQZ8_9ACTN